MGCCGDDQVRDAVGIEVKELRKELNETNEALDLVVKIVGEMTSSRSPTIDLETSLRWRELRNASERSANDRLFAAMNSRTAVRREIMEEMRADGGE